jgi:molybdopterin-binding protein
MKNTNGVSLAPPKKVQKEEIIKCGTDASYFIKKYIKISHPDRGLIKFDTYPFQDECLHDFQSHRMVIVNKSRQLGLSTICAAYSLWMAIFQREKNILVIATKLETAKLFIAKVKTMKQGLPDWLVMPKIQAESVRNVKFSNGSQIKAVPTSADSGRGEALSLLIIDECCFPSTTITVRNKITGEIKELPIGDLYTQI